MDKNSIPKAFQKVLMNDEEVLAVTKKHSLWILGWWWNYLYLSGGIAKFEMKTKTV